MTIRGLPRRDGDLPECLERHSVEECFSPVSFSRSEADPTEDYAGLGQNVAFVDLVKYVCPDGTCPAVIGNVLTFRDHSHLSATYAATLAPFVADEIAAVTGWQPGE